MNQNRISENYKRITENIEKACSDYNRKNDVRLMAVTKGVSADDVNHSISLGINLIGENRVQEFLQKHPFYAKNCEIHFIGGLQNNKVKYIIDKVSVIQSADSFKLLSEINKRAQAALLVADVLIEINIGGEASKHGVKAEELFDLLAQADELTNVRPRGLMAIPPIGAKESVYHEMRGLFLESAEQVKEKDKFDTLSMGMSGDYVMAIKHGANIIRIGSALFG